MKNYCSLFFYCSYAFVYCLCVSCAPGTGLKKKKKKPSRGTNVNVNREDLKTTRVDLPNPFFFFTFFLKKKKKKTCDHHLKPHGTLPLKYFCNPMGHGHECYLLIARCIITQSLYYDFYMLESMG